jgi:hypothetical protein
MPVNTINIKYLNKIKMKPNNYIMESDNESLYKQQKFN